MEGKLYPKFKSMIISRRGTKQWYDYRQSINSWKWYHEIDHYLTETPCIINQVDGKNIEEYFVTKKDWIE